MRKISVIIPCYNVSLYIDRCMSSIAGQTIGMDCLEIICIDDASTDDTWEHLQRWEQLYPDHVVLIRQEVNRRQGAARNMGVSVSSSDWISFVDADDWLEPDFFEKLYKPVAQYACDVVACEWVRDDSEVLSYMDKSRRIRGKEQYIAVDTEEVRKSLLRSGILGDGIHAKLIRRRMLVDCEIFFPEDLTYEDMYWNPLLYVYAAGVYIIKEYLYHYFVNPHATVMSRNEMYHMDWVTVQMIKWADYHRRGLFKAYHEEMERDVLMNAACFVKLVIFRFDDPPFSFFQLEREFIKERIPDYERNRYIEDFSELHRFFLRMLYSSINRTEFQQITVQARKSWEIP